MTAQTEVRPNSGAAFAAALGLGVTDGVRAELEFGYRSFRLNKFKGLSGQIGDAAYSLPALSGKLSGSVSTLSLMVNALFAADVWRLRPYVGAGLGMARHRAGGGTLKFTSAGTDY